MYLAGKLKEIHPTVFEALCLVEGLGRLGLKNEESASVTVEVCKRRPLDAQPLIGTAGVDETCLFVLVKAHKKSLLAINPGDRTENEAPLEYDVHWRGCIGAVPNWTEEEFAVRWMKAVSTMNDSPPFEAEPLWEASRARKTLDGLADLLKLKGFEVR